ncbi:MAG: elongation factor 4 [Candidatus Staskawiczbacteria bacterium RIFOXYD2_FULL_37_9]|uniref:Elongation factor 4 n=1 Tax=Candidatus Staskawiczbacteria bacterium RIFOXYB1_FULL_37_44 TaxID=1802223 RepID=A0A1G2IWC6_9BACT|nr:MAG: elongation factor 4 [Candidatus Staskawiczbacteria bacterium RIFOXYB1_FULL_37_44]OGZ83849.1 MAG: elongation factor 4 [Candidatus Staskawiczbacteria bacterium RIFOXYC1_FULL_37_52]OGZ87792.1 MAG: elongation factor 4 [Candidatus Staskawiczbacteria bacterium RIFOXYC2_FULL_37_19]OGZ89356.1 MAG: elongation factor 4 [Candidatus Staskawiczbacteria bacterium RIFOXYD1_FULL_37_110]OGZ94516.1 MAG: elongation factor 4 [Candidatus Staskawiczbacteria bacterium RIFOXYD2_FULL_37_9]
MQENIRNFSIIAHIDHGKSTLADRLLELTGTIDPKKMMPQFLDSMDLEREKGITIKLKSIRMELDELKIENLKLKIPSSRYILNLVDTPGHVDFSYEVSRSLEAVEGCLLLVDATQGIQAQTLANLELALGHSPTGEPKKQNLKIIPVVNKIDSPIAKVEESVEELSNLLNIMPDEIIKISAKDGTNVMQVLETIIKEVPAPANTGNSRESVFRALIFDSEYDSFKGVIAFVRVVDGEISVNEKINLMATNTNAEVKELGYLTPAFSAQKKLLAGDIGYIATGIKEPGKVTAGDTITKLEARNPKSETVEPLPGYKKPVPMVFASLYPENPDDFDTLKVALGKLKLNDPALVFEQEMKEALGRGFNCGFLGTLHIEIISERLQREFGLSLVISTPSVVYKVFDMKGKEILIHSATDWPDQSSIKSSEEPWVSLEVVAPSNQMGKLMEILKSLKGNYLQTDYLSPERAIIIFETPLRGIIANLYDKIKTASQGYASMNYKMLGFRPAKLVKMEILIAGQKEEAFSKIVAENESYNEGKKIVEKLKDVLPPEQFSVALQAVIGGKVIARETISSRRKDVTGYLYGGDVTRKKKLLEKQKKGKKLMKQKGKVNVPTKAFLEVFRA